MDEIKTTKVYELGYHLLSTLTEADVAKFHQEVKDLAAQHEGEIISEMTPELIRLAYPMFKIIDNKRISFETAHFGVIKFEGTIELMEAIAELVKAHKGVLRHLLISTVREDTIAKKRPMRGIQKASKPDNTADNERSSGDDDSDDKSEDTDDTEDEDTDEEEQDRINKLAEEDLSVEGDE